MGNAYPATSSNRVCVPHATRLLSCLIRPRVTAKLSSGKPWNLMLYFAICSHSSRIICSAERIPHLRSPCEPRKQYLHPNGQPRLETEDVFGVTSSSSQGMAELLLAPRLQIGTDRYPSRTLRPKTSSLNSSRSP